MHYENYGQESGAALPPEWAEPVYGMPAQKGQTGMVGIYQAWQRFLARQGYSLGSYCADGDWGKKTKAATREFQKDQDLTVSPEGYMLVGTEIRANAMGLGTADMVKPLTTAEKNIACPAPRPSSQVATSYTPPGTTGTEAVTGPLGTVANVLFTPRGIVTALSSIALLVGVVALVRQGRQGASQMPQMPQMGTANYDPANWTW